MSSDDTHLPAGGIGPEEEEGFLESIAEGAGDVALKTGGVLWTMIKTVLTQFYRYIIVLFLPIPILHIARKQLAYRDIIEEDGRSRLEFYSQPNFVTTIHLIWVGWIVAVLELVKGQLNVETEFYRNLEQITPYVAWFWLFVLCVTILVLGIEFGRVASGFLLATIVILGLAALLYKEMSQVPILKMAFERMKRIDVDLGWGIPFVVSLVLGFTMLISSIWQQLDDRWIVAYKGNFLEHENFQQKDRTIQKGAKTFVHSWPCLLRRWLLFGYGQIEVRDSRGLTEVERIEGIFWAKHVSEMLKSRFETTDVSISMQAVLEEEEEEG